MGIVHTVHGPGVYTATYGPLNRPGHKINFKLTFSCYVTIIFYCHNVSKEN